nr:TALE protein [Tanacetum cinerariifolium]
MMQRGESGDEMVLSDSIMAAVALSSPDQLNNQPKNMVSGQVVAHSESKSCRPSTHVRHANNSESNIVFTEVVQSLGNTILGCQPILTDNSAFA